MCVASMSKWRIVFRANLQTNKLNWHQNYRYRQIRHFHVYSSPAFDRIRIQCGALFAILWMINMHILPISDTHTQPLSHPAPTRDAIFVYWLPSASNSIKMNNNNNTGPFEIPKIIESKQSAWFWFAWCLCVCECVHAGRCVFLFMAMWRRRRQQQRCSRGIHKFIKRSEKFCAKTRREKNENPPWWLNIHKYLVSCQQTRADRVDRFAITPPRPLECTFVFMIIETQFICLDAELLNQNECITCWVAALHLKNGGHEGRRS